MNPFAGKSPTERNKMIAAIVLGVMSLFALWMAFGGSIFSTKKTVTTSVSPTPKPSASPNTELKEVTMPSEQEIDSAYVALPIKYVPGFFSAPDAGRNIFAFYEPPPPTPYSPTPFVERTPKPTPTPIPPPPPAYLVSFIQPQMVYAGSKGFRLEVSGDMFTPEAHISFNGSELPTTFVSPQKLIADVPSTLIAGEGGRTIMVQSNDGKFSNYTQFNVQAAPKPTFQYIGMISRRHSNNDTAYFQEQGKQTPSSARLNDLVGGRFRVVSIASNETVVEDSSLGFRYKLPLFRLAPGQTAPAGGYNPNNPGGYQPGFPQNGGFPQNPNYQQQQDIPGIPNNIPRYNPPQPQQTPPKDDVDDNDDGDN